MKFTRRRIQKIVFICLSVVGLTILYPYSILGIAYYRMVSDPEYLFSLVDHPNDGHAPFLLSKLLHTRHAKIALMEAYVGESLKKTFHRELDGTDLALLGLHENHIWLRHFKGTDRFAAVQNVNLSENLIGVKGVRLRRIHDHFKDLLGSNVDLKEHTKLKFKILLAQDVFELTGLKRPDASDYNPDEVICMLVRKDFDLEAFARKIKPTVKPVEGMDPLSAVKPLKRFDL